MDASATGPTQLNARSWVGVLKRTAAEFRDDNLTDWAAALTYYAVLSLFPAFIALISILGLVVDPQTITRVITDVVSQLGPASAVDTFKEPIEQIANNRSAALLGLIIGVATAMPITKNTPAAPWLSSMFSIALVKMSWAGPGATLPRLSISGCVADSPMRPSTETSTISAGKIDSTA